MRCHGVVVLTMFSSSTRIDHAVKCGYVAGHGEVVLITEVLLSVYT